MTAEKNGKNIGAEKRKQRLAMELRANLLKRKAQARQRKTADTDADDGTKKD